MKSEYVLEKRGGEERKKKNLMRCCSVCEYLMRIEVNEQMRKEEMTVRKGAKRKRGPTRVRRLREGVC